MNRKLFLIGSIVFAFFMLPCSCKRKTDVKENLPPIVKTAVAEKQQNFITVSYPGKIVAEQDVNLSFRIAGPIVRIRVSEGQYVHKGDILAEMDERDYRIQLSATTAKYNQIKAEAERVIELYKRNSVTQNDYDKAVYGLEQITALLHAHTNALSDTKLRAPFNGYVNKVIFEANETVAAGMPVISMIGEGRPQVVINIPASDFINAEKFHRFYCTVNVFPDRKFPLELVNISKKANLNQLFTATLLFDSREKTLPNPGMSANVFIEYNYGVQELIGIPVNSLFSENGKSHVWVVRPDLTVSLREILPIDITRDGTVIVSQGLEAGERIVSAGVHSVKNGQKVRLLKESSDTNVGHLL